MKKALITIILYFISFLASNAEECRNMNAWCGYFAERLDILDPIEGIYDIQIKIDYNDAPAFSDDTTIAIARISGNLFEAYSISGENQNIYFQRVGRTNYYYLTDLRLNIRERIRLEKDGTFLLEHKETEQFLYQGYVIASVRESSIKIFPDESTVQTALFSPMWSGSGFAIGDGYVVTNHHVAGTANLMRVYDDEKGQFFSAKLIASDSANDLAIIKVEDSQFSGEGSVPYVFDEKLKDVASDCFVMGYPAPSMLGREVKFTNGTISSWSGYEGDVSTYQISAPSTHGNSGGPTFDSDGNVIGILSSGVPSLQNVSYAIKVSYLVELIRSKSLNHLLQGKNSIKGLPMPEKVKALKPYVYFILCTSSSSWEEGEQSLSNDPYEWELPKRKVVPNYSTQQKMNRERLTDLEKQPNHIRGRLRTEKWKSIHLTLKVDDYITYTYGTSAEKLSQRFIPLFIKDFNKNAKSKGMVMTQSNSSGVDVEAVWEILIVDEDDGETYSIVSFYEGDECKAQVYINGNGGRGDTLVEKSESSVERSSVKLAKAFSSFY